MAKRILNRKDLRADFDAAERRKVDKDQDETEDELENEDEEDEDAEEEEEEGQSDEEAGDEDEEVVAKPAKKKKAPAKPKAAKPKSRARAAKVTRMRVVWGVFSNSNQCVATFEFPRRKEAEELVSKLTTEKRNTHFLQPVKEPLEEKKEK